MIGGHQSRDPAPAQLHAENEIGAGPAITLLADTPRLAEKRTAESKLAPAGSARAGGAGEAGAGAGSPVAGLVAVVAGAGVALAAVLLCLVTAVVLGVRQRSRQRRHGDSASLGSGHSAADSEYTGECEASYLTVIFLFHSSFFPDCCECLKYLCQLGPICLNHSHKCINT